ncbi:D-tyrosyl-tRNA(Tyr) deacylase [bacterium]|nr:MAG: D-tyrosyl-tRNA(Tyr) deacylase [bacterium]
MRAVVQRVGMASVSVGGLEVGRCGPGLLLLVGIHRDDTEAEAKLLADRVMGLRIFNDPQGKMNLSIRDFPQPEGGFELEVLAVSNFTVYGDAKSRRPSFIASAGFDAGRALFDRFVQEVRNLGGAIQTGEFGADMRVSLVNDGPVTLILDVGPNA